MLRSFVGYIHPLFSSD